MRQSTSKLPSNSSCKVTQCVASTKKQMEQVRKERVRVVNESLNVCEEADPWLAFCHLHSAIAWMLLRHV